MIFLWPLALSDLFDYANKVTFVYVHSSCLGNGCSTSAWYTTAEIKYENAAKQTQTHEQEVFFGHKNIFSLQKSGGTEKLI